MSMCALTMLHRRYRLLLPSLLRRGAVNSHTARCGSVRLAELVDASVAVTATPARNEKVALLAALLARAEPEDVAPVVSWLSGELTQRQIGVGWALLRDRPAPAPVASLTVAELERELDAIGALRGPGSVTARRAAVQALLARADAAEQEFLARLLLGDLGQGALAGVMTDAVARAAGLPGSELRRALTLHGDLAAVAAIALRDGRDGLAAIRLRVGRPLAPMLAGTAPDVEAAVAKTGPAAVDWKLDGARLQVHRDGDEVALFTRTLDDVTARLPEVVAAARSLPVRSIVLDGEAVAPELHVPRRITEDAAAAAETFDAALAAGHEGVVVKALDAPYAAGRRGSGWLKVKPVHTLDLVVLAAEWGHGRRRGRLSNLHLGARDEESGGWAMLGKTFKGLTDELLEWQTRRLLELETHREGIAVHVRPELVVEIAFDGVQTSQRYPSGMTLRFARVKRYRDDKPAAAADTVATVRAFRDGGH